VPPITDFQRGLINRLAAAAAPNAPAGTTGIAKTPLPEGVGFVGDYSDWSDTWSKAANKVLEPEFEGGSAEANIRLFKAKVQKLITNSPTLGSNSDKASPIGYARGVYKRVRAQFGVLAGDQLKGIQLHHAIDELAADPLGALDAENLMFARGNAATEDSLHWILHELNIRKAAGARNPGREALLDAVKRGKIPKSLFSPTLETPSTRVKTATTAAEGEHPSSSSGRAMEEYQPLTQMGSDTSISGGSDLGGRVGQTFSKIGQSFSNLGEMDGGTGPEQSKAHDAATRGLIGKGIKDKGVPQEPAWWERLIGRDSTPDAGTLMEADDRAKRKFLKETQY